MFNYFSLSFFGLLLCSFRCLFAQDIVRFEILRGEEIIPFQQNIVELCHLRYAQYPYLYAGDDAEYESYLSTYSQSAEAVICAAFAGDDVIGIAAGMPMMDTREYYQKTLVEHGYDLGSLFYLGEVAVLPEYRQSNLETQLIQKIEHFAKEQPRYKTLCCWELDDSLSLDKRPAEYVPSNSFFVDRGFSLHAELQFSSFWTNINETEESEHRAFYWLKELQPASTSLVKKVVLYAGDGVGDESLIQTIKTFGTLLENQYVFELITPEQVIEGGWEEGTALFIMPGGADLPYVRDLAGEGNRRIVAFVEGGGSYLGICAGGYYGGGRVEFAEGTSLEVIGERELAFFPGIVRGPALCEYDYSSNRGARAACITGWGGLPSAVVYCNGGGYYVDADSIGNVSLLATYDSMDGEAAIVKCEKGKGVAILSGVHFEYDPQLLDNEDFYLGLIIPELAKAENQRIELIKGILRELNL